MDKCRKADAYMLRVVVDFRGEPDHAGEIQNSEPRIRIQGGDDRQDAYEHDCRKYGVKAASFILKNGQRRKQAERYYLIFF